ncbi:MAG: mobile mystery protein B [Gemmatimonadota bacterium]|nr:mobile mystery protein B [Gemmatimonadota bacterium]MDH5760808.1 mobile mystery protein B [Gemmatimonadota bacterium]
MFEYPPGATPIDADEAEGLLPGHLTTQTDLNEWEQANIATAAAWIRTTRLDPFDFLAVKKLHERMFDRMWSWAGHFRTTEKSIGVAPEEISVRLRDLLDDGRYRLQNGTFPVRECALRLHHRLVFVHLFPNGNGRHARLWANWILLRAGEPVVDWGGNLGNAGALRVQYIASLRAADGGDYSPLLELFGASGT